MKFKFFKTRFRIGWNNIYWGPDHLSDDFYPYYIYWCSWIGWKPIEYVPYVGIYRMWYDGPHAVFRLGPLSASWSTPWTEPPDGFK